MEKTTTTEKIIQRGIIGTFIILMGVFLFVKLFLTDELIAESFKLTALQETLYALRVENTDLTDAILQAESLTEINQKAQQMGFVKAVYISP